MENLLNTVKCVECNCILQSPVILPCGKSVCQKHVSQQDSTNSYNCHICGNVHSVPENGFVANDAINLLIDLSLGDYKQALKSCELLKTTIAELESLKSQPECHVRNVIDELKNEVRTKRDALIEEIENASEAILVELDIYQRECSKSMHSLTSTFNQIENNVDTKKMTLETLLNELNRLEADSQASWKSISERSEFDVAELSSIIEEVKDTLLMNKLDELKEKQVKFCQLKLLNSGERQPLDLDNLNPDRFHPNVDPDLFEYQIRSNNIDEYDNYVDDNASSIRGSQNISGSQSYRDLDESNNHNKVRLSEKEVERIYQKGHKSLKNFSSRLLTRYFSKQELLDQNFTVCGRGSKKPLDPVRIGFIRDHLTYYNGGNLSEVQWSQCKSYMSAQSKKFKKPTDYKKIDPAKRNVYRAMSYLGNTRRRYEITTKLE